MRVQVRGSPPGFTRHIRKVGERLEPAMDCVDRDAFHGDDLSFGPGRVPAASCRFMYCRSCPESPIPLKEGIWLKLKGASSCGLSYIAYLRAIGLSGWVMVFQRRPHSLELGLQAAQNRTRGPTPAEPRFRV